MTLTHDWFDIREKRLIDEPIEPSDANEPTLPIESTEPTLPIDRTDPDDPIDSNESRLANDHCPREILITSAYAASAPEILSPTRRHEPDHGDLVWAWNDVGRLEAAHD
ncbi:MAG: hypothetical protein ABI112_02120 [Terracoccus sp.]